MVEPKLNFVIGGAQKSGTCSVDAMFRMHPRMQMASIKETHFFNDESRDWQNPDYADLHAYFHAADDRLRGEATPATLYWRPAIDRLARYNPDIKLIVILRDPITRAYSNWRHEYARKRETLTFSEAIRAGRSRVAAAPGGLHLNYAYVERGLYGDQLQYLLRHFPKENIHCEIFEEFFADRAGGLARMARFLGVGAFPGDLPDFHLNPAHDVAYPSSLSEEDIAHLADLYRDQIGAVEAFLGRRVERWHH